MSCHLPERAALLMRPLRALALGAFALALAGCGGSGGDPPHEQNPPPPPATPTAEDLQNARSATLKMLLVAANNELIVSWTDTFGAEKGYAIERRVQSGPWEQQELLPATPGTGLEYRWSRVIDSPALYRVVAVRDGYSVALQQASGESEVAVGPPGATLQLQVDKPEPLREIVQVSVDGAATARAVHYFVDTHAIGVSANAPTFAVTWDPTTVPDGDHLLQAQVDLAGGSVVELRRVVITDSPNVQVSLDVSESGDRIRLRAAASSDAGIQSVEFFRDGVSLAVINAPNDGSDYTYLVEKSGLPAGPTVFKAIATDGALEKDEAEVQFVIEHPAFLTLSAPVNGAIVSGNLLVEGVFGDDEPGATLSISLGDIEIARPTASPFSASYSLAGLPGGSYTLITTLRDSAGRTQVRYRQVIVSTTQLAYDLVAAGVGPHSALDTENGALLYQRPDETFVVRSPAGDETQLQIPASVTDPEPYVGTHAWQIDSGRVAMASSRGQNQVHVFGQNGTARTVSGEVFPTSDTNHSPVLRWPWIAWSALGEVRIYNLETLALHRLSVVGADYAFAGAPGSERLIFSSTTPTNGYQNVFVYDMSAQATVAVTSEAAQQHSVQGDETRAAWAKLPLGGQGLPFQLIVGPAANPSSPSAVSMTVDGFQLQDGLLAWTETASGVRASLKADDGSATTTISSASSVELYSASGRHVIFGENGKLYVWSTALGRRVLLDVLPKDVVQRDGVAFVVTGACLEPWWVPCVNAIHRVSLP